MHIFGVTMMVIMTLTPSMIATESSPLISPLSSTGSLLFHDPIENKKQVGGKEKEIRYQLQQDENANFQEDYGVWNPTPRSGGPYASPVPHAKQMRNSTSLPKSFQD
ncbi:hypothetical protein CRYUN_Cryun27aG0103100 [Craigia yunnanensis]